MIEHDFPSKHETKQTSSLTIKTCIPLLAPTVPKMEPLGILSTRTQLLGTNHSEERGRSFCDEQWHPVAATKGRKCRAPSSWSQRNPQVLKNELLENTAPSFHLRRITSGRSPLSPEGPCAKPAFAKHLLSPGMLISGFSSLFFFMVATDA